MCAPYPLPRVAWKSLVVVVVVARVCRYRYQVSFFAPHTHTHTHTQERTRAEKIQSSSSAAASVDGLAGRGDAIPVAAGETLAALRLAFWRRNFNVFFETEFAELDGDEEEEEEDVGAASESGTGANMLSHG